MSDITFKLKSGSNKSDEKSEISRNELEKLNKYKILYQALKSCPLSANLAEKFKEIELSNATQQVLQLSEHNNLLGVSPERPQLNTLETLELQSAIMEHLQKTQENIQDEIKSRIPSENNEKPPLEVTLEFKNKLENMQRTYLDNLEVYADLLSEIARERLEELPQIAKKKLGETQLQMNLNELRYNLTQAKIRTDIFKESPCSFQAYKNRIEDLEKQIEIEKNEVEELKNLRKQYDKVKCKEFDNIVKEYNYYKNALDKRKRVLAVLENTSKDGPVEEVSTEEKTLK